MNTTVFRNTILIVQTSEHPTQGAWDEHVSQLEDLDQALSGDLSRCGLLVFTDGGGPNAKQRHQVNTWLRGRRWPVGIVSSSSFIRGLGAAMSWFNKSMRVFAPKDWQAAALHAGVVRGDLPHIQKIVEEMAAKVGGTKTVSDAFAGEAKVSAG